MSPAWDKFIAEVWYGRHALRFVLIPLSWVFRLVAHLRRAAYQSGLLGVYRSPVPVIVVGNLTVGGTGKTPLVIWLAQLLRDYGFRPGVITRGYRGGARHWPQQVRPDSDVRVVGDEALLIARRTGLPVAAGPDRAQDIESLIEHSKVNIIVSDDGMQHYAMARDLEIAVLDGVRRLGNGYCLPAGPLREPAPRLAEVDLIVTQGLAGRGEFALRYDAKQVLRVDREMSVPLADFAPKSVHAVAATGNPESFFKLLRKHGFRITPHAFPDHYQFRRQDFEFGDDAPIVMTEKDAVKCEFLNDSRMWYVPIDIELPAVIESRLRTLLRNLFNGQEAA